MSTFYYIFTDYYQSSTPYQVWYTGDYIMTVLGIETSCDETAVGIVVDGKRLVANVVASSMDIHAKYGGVVPEIAARSHIEAMIPVVEEALSQAQCGWDAIDAIAVTYGPGLGGSLLIGVLAARTLAIAKHKPLYAVNHVEAHLYVNFLTETSLPDLAMQSAQPEFPMLGVIVSGNHSELVLFRDHFDYTMLGRTYDDALGEAFDKVARMLGMSYPGGIKVEILADQGDPHAFALPKARMSGKYDFSYSGLKTAVLRLAQAQAGKDYTFPSTQLPGLLSEAQKADIAASFCCTAMETMVDKVIEACEEFHPKSVIIGGGVAASPELRKQLDARLPSPIEYPARKLCTDNGAMIAALGCFRHMLKQPQADPYSLEIAPNLNM